MRNRFVKTKNVELFLAGLNEIETRGAPEASLMLVTGHAGHGKSRTAQWYATQQDAAFVRIKAAATPHWLLTDLVRELGEPAPAHSCEKLFAQAVNILAREPRTVVVDEVESALRDMKVIETLRDISDMTEVPVIMVGREFVKGTLRRQTQIWSRISALVEFGPVKLDDVRLCLDELCEVETAPEIAELILSQSEGRIREVMKAIANVERRGRHAGGKALTPADFKGKTLTHDFQATRKPQPAPGPETPAKVKAA